jgi:tetratricopeptide (TPR) repeat protein
MRRYAEAIDYCGQAIAIFPYTTEAYTIQMEIFYDADLFDRMLTLSGQADQVGFDSPRVKYHKACALRMQEKVEEAKEILSALLQADFDEGYSDFFHVEMAYLAVSEEDYNTALEHITRAIEINGEFIYRYVFLGNVCRLRNEFGQALEIYGALLEKQPGYVHALLGRGDVYYDMKDYIRARGDYEAALSCGECNERAIDRIIDVYAAEHRYAEAIPWGERAKNLFGSINKSLRLAWLYSQEGRNEEAIAILDGVEQTGDVTIRKGLIFQKMGRHKESLELLLKASALEGEIGGHWSMPYIYTLTGIKFATYFNDAPNAMRYYKLALERDPDSSSAIKNMGDLYLYYYKDYAAALQFYERKIELDPDDPHGYFARAQVYRLMKRHIRAAREFRKALAIFRDRKKGLRDEEALYYQVQIALCYAGLKKYSLAGKLFDEVLADGGKWHECYFGLGVVSEGERKYSEALEYYEMAIALADAVQYNAARDALMRGREYNR